MLRLALKLTAFVAGAWLSYEYLTEPWVVGGVFAVVVLTWLLLNGEPFHIIRFGTFAAASVLVYALVIWTDRQAWVPNEGLFEYVFIPAILGTVLLPMFHALIFKIQIQKALIAIPLIYAALWASGYVLNLIELPRSVSSVVNAVAVWQLAYLILLTGNFRKSGS